MSEPGSRNSAAGVAGVGAGAAALATAAGACRVRVISTLVVANGPRLLR